MITLIPHSKLPVASPASSLPQSLGSATNPDHYSRQDPEPLEVIERWNLPFHLGNVIKYIARAPFKGSELQDLRKARKYLDRWIKLREAKIAGVEIHSPREDSEGE